jgi:molybdopterin molybdotransferase
MGNALAVLIEIERARELVLARVHPLSGERVTLADALGRVLAEDVSAAEPVPAFDNSAMDGFAVRAEDTSGAAPGAGIRLRVVDESRAGLPARARVGAGEAIRISTGAMLPVGADAVVPVEDTSVDEQGVWISREVEARRDVRSAGDDIAAGAQVLGSGVELGPVELGVLASLGRSSVLCRRKPTVAVLTTGDELLEPDEPWREGCTRNTNAYAIPALARRCGATVSSTERVGDALDDTREAIDAALAHDVVVICGGVSVGEHDHVRPALASLGVEQIFWGVALRPGRPTWFGTSSRAALVFGLPGNPVSAVVTFLLFVRPALRALLGAAEKRPAAQAFLDEDYAKPPGRAHAVRCRLELRDDGWHARPTGAQGSHVLTSMLGADALAFIPSDNVRVRAGEPVDVELLPPK